MYKRVSRLSFCATICLVAFVVNADETRRHNYKPDERYVPDAETAIAIAVAVWNPI